MDIPFYKMHGAANDFILVDDRKLSFPAEDRAWMAQQAHRRTGVGSDGLLLIQPSDQADFRMRFFNPDGGEAEMCGNGARCVARLASELGVCGNDMAFETVAGVVRAHVDADRVKVFMTPPEDWRLDRELDLPPTPLTYHFVNTGVPHVVVLSDDVAAEDVAARGRAIREHAAFSPEGANVNFVQVTGPNALRVRTYERGVEAETCACGTGITASGLVAGRLGLVAPPVEVTANSEDIILIDYRPAGETAEEVTMTGPAVHVFQGVLTYS